jgi:hypothetical protein
MYVTRNCHHGLLQLPIPSILREWSQCVQNEAEMCAGVLLHGRPDQRAGSGCSNINEWTRQNHGDIGTVRQLAVT